LEEELRDMKYDKMQMPKRRAAEVEPEEISLEIGEDEMGEELDMEVGGDIDAMIKQLEGMGYIVTPPEGEVGDEVVAPPVRVTGGA